MALIYKLPNCSLTFRNSLCYRYFKQLYKLMKLVSSGEQRCIYNSTIEVTLSNPT